MKYYSDKTKKIYDSALECTNAENKYYAEVAKKNAEKEKAVAERKTRAKEVEDARKAMITAQHKYREVLEAFTKDYGSYHLSLTGEDAKKMAPTLFDIFNPFFFDF